MKSKALMNTVTKVDTTTYQILGRYAIGSHDPSRTSVNSLGDVFVGNRAGNTLTKVSAAGVDCPDTNGDNAITTSSGFNDVLAWGQDDCVLWDVPVPGGPHVRGVAAQDLLVPDPLVKFTPLGVVEVTLTCPDAEEESFKLSARILPDTNTRSAANTSMTMR